MAAHASMWDSLSSGIYVWIRPDAVTDKLSSSASSGDTTDSSSEQAARSRNDRSRARRLGCLLPVLLVVALFMACAGAIGVIFGGAAQPPVKQLAVFPTDGEMHAAASQMPQSTTCATDEQAGAQNCSLPSYCCSLGGSQQGDISLCYDPSSGNASDYGKAVGRVGDCKAAVVNHTDGHLHIGLLCCCNGDLCNDGDFQRMTADKASRKYRCGDDVCDGSTGLHPGVCVSVTAREHDEPLGCARTKFSAYDNDSKLCMHELGLRRRHSVNSANNETVSCSRGNWLPLRCKTAAERSVDCDADACFERVDGRTPAEPTADEELADSLQLGCFNDSGVAPLPLRHACASDRPRCYLTNSNRSTVCCCAATDCNTGESVREQLRRAERRLGAWQVLGVSAAALAVLLVLLSTLVFVCLLKTRVR